MKGQSILTEKCVAEFIIHEQLYTPYAKFIIKIYQGSESSFYGVANICVKDSMGQFCRPIGWQNCIDRALENTIQSFLKMTSRKSPRNWLESDFMCLEHFNFDIGEEC